jgi:hypothetical protein
MTILYRLTERYEGLPEHLTPFGRCFLTLDIAMPPPVEASGAPSGSSVPGSTGAWRLDDS